MHGRARHRVAAESAPFIQQQLAESKKKARKLRQLQDLLVGWNRQQIYDDEAVNASTALLEGNPDLYVAWNYRKRAFVHRWLKAARIPVENHTSTPAGEAIPPSSRVTRRDASVPAHSISSAGNEYASGLSARESDGAPNSSGNDNSSSEEEKSETGVGGRDGSVMEGKSAGGSVRGRTDEEGQGPLFSVDAQERDESDRESVRMTAEEGEEHKETGEAESLRARMALEEAELRVVEAALMANPKAYGAWHHRKWMFALACERPHHSASRPAPSQASHSTPHSEASHSTPHSEASHSTPHSEASHTAPGSAAGRKQPLLQLPGVAIMAPPLSPSPASSSPSFTSASSSVRTSLLNPTHIQREQRLLLKLLTADDRNFHAWDYWRFLCSLADIQVAERLQFTTDRVNANFSNYSAWHSRSALHSLLHPPLSSPASSSQLSSQSAQPPLSRYPPKSAPQHASQPPSIASSPSPEHPPPSSSSSRAPQHRDSSPTAWLSSEFSLLRQAFYTEPDDQSAWLYLPWLLRNVLPPPPPRLLSCLLTCSPLLALAPASTPTSPLLEALAIQEEPSQPSSSTAAAAAAGLPVGRVAAVLLFSEPVCGVAQESVSFRSPCFTAVEWQAGGQGSMHCSGSSCDGEVARESEGVKMRGSRVWYSLLEGSCRCECQGGTSPLAASLSSLSCLSSLSSLSARESSSTARQQQGQQDSCHRLLITACQRAEKAVGCPHAALDVCKPWSIVAVSSGLSMAGAGAGAGAGARAEAGNMKDFSNTDEQPACRLLSGVAGLVGPTSASAQQKGESIDCSLSNNGSSSSRAGSRVAEKRALPDPWRLQLLDDEIAACKELMELEEGSKWPILSSARLLIARCSLSPHDNDSPRITHSLETVTAWLQQLQRIDPMRGSFYDHMASHMTRQLQSPPSNRSPHTATAPHSTHHQPAVSLARRGLRCLPVGGLSSLQAIVSLDLSHNRIAFLSALQGIECLPSLRRLNLAHNLLGSSPVDSFRYIAAAAARCSCLVRETTGWHSDSHPSGCTDSHSSSNSSEASVSFACPCCCQAVALSLEASREADVFMSVIMAAQRAASVSGSATASPCVCEGASLLLAALPPVVLLRMRRLEELDLRGNPLCHLAGYEPMMTALLPAMGLSTLDGNQVARSKVSIEAL